MFCKDGYIEEKTMFDKNSFSYVVQTDEDLDALRADFQGNTIIMSVPAQSVKNWDNNAQVGFANELVLENGTVLSLLLEKDFACLENRGEDESDNYPNPRLSEQNHG